MSDKSGTTRELLPWLISGTSLLIKGTNNLLYLGILSVFLRNYGSEFLPWFYIILNISFISFQFGVTPHIIGKKGTRIRRICFYNT